MYDFLTKKKLKKRAQAGHIQTYRAMLSERQVPASGWVAINPQELAEDLLYILLDYYSIEEIEARASGAVPAADHFRDATKKVGDNPGSEPVKKKVSKQQEYPNIRWKDMDDPVVRLADSIFSDRISCWQRLQELEKLTQEESAPVAVLQEIIQLEIRRELCFQELRHLNDKGSFLGKHPFISQKSEREQVFQMLKDDPEKYFDERKKIEDNISRYSSQINGKKSSEAVRERAKASLEKYQVKLQLYKDVFREFMGRQ